MVMHLENLQKEWFAKRFSTETKVTKIYYYVVNDLVYLHRIKYLF